MTNIVERLRKSYPCRHQDEDDPRTKTTDTCVDSQSMCLCELEDRKEAANEIERLRAELAAQNWQPIETAPKDASLILMKFEKKDLYKDQIDVLNLYLNQIGDVDIVYWLEDFKSLPFFVNEYDLKNDRWFSIVVGQYVKTKKQNPTHWMPLPEPPQQENEK